MGVNGDTATSDRQGPRVPLGEWELQAVYAVGDDGSWRNARANSDRIFYRFSANTVTTLAGRLQTPLGTEKLRIVRLPGGGCGVFETKGRNGADRSLYRFRGTHIELCVNPNKRDRTPDNFNAKGTVVLVLVPSEYGRIVMSYKLQAVPKKK
jgi:hypothetical protein